MPVVAAAFAGSFAFAAVSVAFAWAGAVFAGSLTFAAVSVAFAAGVAAFATSFFTHSSRAAVAKPLFLQISVAVAFGSVAAGVGAGAAATFAVSGAFGVAGWVVCVWAETAAAVNANAAATNIPRIFFIVCFHLLSWVAFLLKDDEENMKLRLNFLNGRLTLVIALFARIGYRTRP